MNPVLALIIANIIWGAASPIFKFALENIPPFTLAFARFFIASLIFLPFMIYHWEPITLKDLLKICLAAFFGLTINIGFFFLGLAKTSSINAPIIASSGPVFLYFLAIFFLREKPRAKILLGMIVALLGVLLIIFSPVLFDGKILDFSQVEGNLLILIATLGSIIDPIINKGNLKKVKPFQLTSISFIFACFTFFPLMLGELHKWSFMQLDIRGITGIIFGAFLSSGLAYSLYYFGMSKIDSQEIGLFSYIDPIIAVLIAIPLLGEYPNLYFFLGSIFVFGGIYLAEGRIHYHPFHRISHYKNKA